jgi:hypothetical protein
MKLGEYASSEARALTVATKMPACYIVEPIGPRTVDRAYPLARACGCALTLGEWQAWCQALVLARACDEAIGDGALVAREAQGYVKGLCVYSTRDVSPYGRLLDVPIFVVVSAADPQGVTAELVGALRSKCERSGCSGIRFWPMRPDAWTRRQSPEADGRTDHKLFLRPLASAAEMEAVVSARTYGTAAAID